MFTPNTEVRLLQNVDISNSYKNTFSFLDRASQTSFFLGKTKHTFTDFLYQRKEKTLKVPGNIESMYNVNYMMFKNSNFSNRWFYAFITDMKYINDVTTEIMFEIDVIQTWYFDMDIKQSFVEREHVSDDGIGKHLLEENLDIGTPTTMDYRDSESIKDLSYVLVSTVDMDGVEVEGDVYSGVYSGLTFFATSDVTWINDFINTLDTMGKSEALITIFTIPESLVYKDLINRVIGGNSGYFVLDGTDKYYGTLDGYTPKNNKLLCYPYNYLEVTDNKGTNKIYPYEYFSSPIACEFFITCNIAPSPSVFLTPYYFNGIYQNNDESMVLGDYPICAWNSDVYSNWLAQNQVSNAVRVGGSLLSLGVGVATSNPIGIASGVLGVSNSIGSFKEMSIKPPKASGGASGGANIARVSQTFTFMNKTIRYEYAKRIDDYFSMYGYKVSTVKVPNIRTRPNWNYVKLLEPNIFGDIPNSDLMKIHQIFKDGLTFWHNDNVGNYNRNNGGGGGSTGITPDPIPGGTNPNPNPNPTPGEVDPTTYTVNSLGYVFPLKKGVAYTKTSDYGLRIHPITGEEKFHYGVDLACAEGTNILSILDEGIVSLKGYSESMGNYVYVDYTYNGDKYQAICMHMVSSAYVNRGDVVNKGSVLGGVGTTGASTGNHLHFGLKKNGSYVDPWLYINPSL